MLRVGLTGNIASGKSTVVDVWRSLGASVIDADVLARAAMAPGTPGHARVIEAFGTDDRTKLRDIVFRDAGRRAELERLIHPEVARLREERERALQLQGADIIVNDIPLLYEAGLADSVDIIVLVDAPRDVRVQRIVDHRGLERTEAERMVDAQQPAEMKRARADYIIDNDGSIADLRTHAEEVWQKIKARASA